MNPFKMKRKSVLLFLLISIYSCSIDNKKNNQILDENSSIEILENSKKEKTSMLEKIQDELIIINELLDKKNNLTNTISVSRLIIKPEALNHFIDFQGTVKSDKNIIVFPEMNGILKHIYVKEGQKVKKGQLLAESSNEVLKIKLEQLILRNNLLKTTFERNEKLWGKNIGSEIEYLRSKTEYLSSTKNIKELEKQIEKTKFYAQFSGTIDEIFSKIGSNINAGLTPILRLINLDQIYVESEIPEKHILNIKKGSKVIISLFNSEKINSKITKVGNHINPSNRSFKVRIDIEESKDFFKPNMSCRIKINDYSSDNSILIPVNNILEDSNGEFYVYKIVQENDFESLKSIKTPVITGKSIGNRIEIIKGLKINDQIVQDGLRLIKNNQNIKIIK